MATNTLLQSLSRESVRFLIIACERFYTQSLLGGPNQSNSLNIEIPELIKLLGKSKWNSKKEFFQDIIKITGLTGIGEDQIKQVSNALYVQESKIPLEKEAVSRTVPLNIKEMTEEYERTKDEKRKTELARKIQRARRELQKPKEEIKEALKGKTLYAEPKEPLPKIQLAPKEKQALDKLIKSAQGSQTIFVAKLTKQIIENASPEIKKVIPPDQLEIAANRVALDVSDRLLNQTPVAPPEVFVSLASPSAKLETAIPLPIAADQVRQAGATFAVISKASDTTTRLLLYPVLGKNITSTIYGSSEATYTITAIPTENTAFTISPSILYNDFSTFKQSPVYEALNNPAVDIAKDKLTSFGKDTLVAQLKNLPKEGPLGFISRFTSSGTFESGISLLSGFRTEYAATNILGKFITTFLPEYTPIIGGVANFLKVNLGLAPVVAGTVETSAVGAVGTTATIAGGAIKATLGKAVTSIGAKLGLSAVFSQIGAALGSVAPIIGNLIGLAVGWLLGKIAENIPWDKVKKAAPYIIGLLIGISMAIFFGPVIGAVVGLGTFGILSGIGLGGIGLGIARFSAGLGKAFVITIGTPVIITLLAFPVLVALILFIINSGAYLVPPKPVSDFPFGPGLECTTEKDPVSFPNSASAPTAKRAWEITSDLYQGFWCSWNRSPGDFPEDKTDYPPSYPELFNEDLFARNPNPTREQISSCGECLFWCTWLVQKAYTENGIAIEYTLWSPTMMADFARRNKFIKAKDVTFQKAVPGSVIFFDVENELERVDHVGILYSANADDVTYIQSNAGFKEGHLTIGPGGLQGIRGFIDVVGIGTP